MRSKSQTIELVLGDCRVGKEGGRRSRLWKRRSVGGARVGKPWMRKKRETTGAPKSSMKTTNAESSINNNNNTMNNKLWPMDTIHSTTCIITIGMPSNNTRCIRCSSSSISTVGKSHILGTLCQAAGGQTREFCYEVLDSCFPMRSILAFCVRTRRATF